MSSQRDVVLGAERIFGTQFLLIGGNAGVNVQAGGGGGYLDHQLEALHAGLVAVDYRPAAIGILQEVHRFPLRVMHTDKLGPLVQTGQGDIAQQLAAIGIGQRGVQSQLDQIVAGYFQRAGSTILIQDAGAVAEDEALDIIQRDHDAGIQVLDPAILTGALMQFPFGYLVFVARLAQIDDVLVTPINAVQLGRPITILAHDQLVEITIERDQVCIMVCVQVATTGVLEFAGGRIVLVVLAKTIQLRRFAVDNDDAAIADYYLDLGLTHGGDHALVGQDKVWCIDYRFDIQNKNSRIPL